MIGGSLGYIAVWALIAGLVRSPAPFVAGVSFVHYGLYLATLARRDVGFATFVRVAVLFKALSMAVLAWIWLASGPSPASITLVIGGVGLSSWAAWVLGFERTYFGAELGRVPPARIDRAPYGWVPHPMILGAVIALVGVELQPEVRASWPWLVPTHVGLYLVHLAQEAALSRARSGGG